MVPKVGKMLRVLFAIILDSRPYVCHQHNTYPYVLSSDINSGQRSGQQFVILGQQLVDVATISPLTYGLSGVSNLLVRYQ